MPRHRPRTPTAAHLLLLGLLLGPAARGQTPSPLLEPPVLEAIRIEGVSGPRADEVRRLLSLEPGAQLEQAEAWQSRRRILEAGGFDTVDLRLERGAAPGRVVLVVAVREAASMVLTADLGSLSGGQVALGAEARLRGRLRLSGQAFLGEELPGFALGLDVEDVWLPRTGMSARLYRRGREGLFPAAFPIPPDVSSTDDEILAAETGLSFSRAGLSLELRRPLGTGAWSLSLGHRLEALSGENRNGAQALGGTQQILSVASLGVAHQRMDSELWPRRGHRLRLRLNVADSVLGSEAGFVRVLGRAEGRVPLSGRLGARLELRGGTLAGGAPLTEHFFAGDLVRGYSTYAAAGGIGGRQGLGGSFELGAELTQATSRRRARVLGFVDLGGLWGRSAGGRGRSGFAASAGVGLELQTGFGLIGIALPVVVRDLDEPAAALPMP
jgi:outer membrane protein assembly factor BamA